MPVGVWGFVATARGAPIPCAHHARVWSGDTLDSSGRGSGTERFKSFHDEPLGVALAIGHCRHDPHGNKLSQAAPYRGPFTKGRIIDLSTGAANALGFSGVQHVNVAVLGKK